MALQKMKVSVSWTIAYCNWTGRFYSVSPTFGVLVVNPQKLSSIKKRLLGFRQSEYLSNLEMPKFFFDEMDYEDVSQNDLLNEEPYSSSLSYDSLSMLRRRLNDIAFKNRKKTNYINYSLYSLLSCINKQYRTDEFDQCLVNSFRSAIKLVEFKVPFSLNIGIFLPTNNLHAWIECGEFVVGDNVDNLIHYVKLVTYEFTEVD